MPEKEFKVELGNGYYIVSESFRENGIVERFVVRLMFINSAGELFIVARFDTAHGIAHFDRLSKSGRLLEKVWLNGLDFNRAYEYALNEFRQNHEYYVKRWEES
ncbi:MAG: hypothetical protein WCG66_10195 [bacterium]